MQRGDGMRLRHVLCMAPKPQPEQQLRPDALVTFAPMEALADGLGGLDTSRTRPFGELAASNYNYFAEGDVLLAKVTPCFENGKKALAEGLVNGIGYATSEVHVLRPDPRRIDPRYLLYLLSSEDFRAAGMASMTGAGGLRRVGESAVMDYRPKVTSLAQQKAIADFLDRETARIDQLIEKKKRLIMLLRQKQAAKLDMFTFNWAGADSVQRVPFKWICRVPQGQVDPTLPQWSSKPLIAPNHIESGTGRLQELQTAEEQGAISGKYAFPAGTVLYSKIRPALAKACIAPEDGLCSADMYPIIPDRRLRPQYLLMQLLSASFTDWAATESMRVAMPKINRDTLGNIRLTVPSLEEQDRFIADYAEAWTKIEAGLRLTERSIEDLREFRSALVTAAVTGQIDIAAGAARGPGRRLDEIEREMAS